MSRAQTWNAPTPASARDGEFAARVGECRRRVFQIAYSVLRNAGEAEEVAQEAFLQAYRRFASLRDPERFRAWVGRIAFRHALNQRRARGRRVVRENAWFESREAASAGAEGADRRILAGQVRDTIERLPEQARSVLLLAAVEGMEPTEMAGLLGVPAGTVRSRLHRARRLLLEEMER